MSTTEIVVVVLVAAVASLVKSITGIGYPLVLIPVLALFMDVAEAVVIVAPPNFFLNGRLIWSMRDDRPQVDTLPRFVIASAAGAVVGAVLLPNLPDTALRVVLIGVIVLFVGNYLRGRTFSLTETRARQLAPAVGGIAGVFQGAASISGPIVTPWFLSLGLARDAYIFGVAVVFALTGIVQAVVFTIQGTFTLGLLGLGVLLIPLAVLVFPVGVRIRERVSLKAFERLVLVLLAASAVSLLVRIL